MAFVTEDTFKLRPQIADGFSMGSETFAVEAVGLKKAYGEKIAVGCLGLAVPRGSFFGVVGPNGAGKTTTLRMMTGLLRPDAGRVIIDGIDVWANPIGAKERIGVLPDDLRLFDRLTGEQFLTYIGRLRRMDIPTAKKRCAEVLELLGLTESSQEIVADYSQGMRKKVALGAAIMHVPKVLFLDEPFESVDPVSSRMVQQVLAKFRAEGGTVIFSSHVMETVENLCDYVAIVHGGAIVANGETDVLRAGRTLEQTFIESVGAKEVRLNGLGWLQASLRAAT
jgi:ABC-2 type transport system ATP-binding protein